MCLAILDHVLIITNNMQVDHFLYLELYLSVHGSVFLYSHVVGRTVYVYIGSDVGLQNDDEDHQFD